MAESSRLSNPGVHFPPPILLAVGFLGGWLIDRKIRALPLWRGQTTVLEVVGVIIAVAGFAFAAWGALTFRRARTAIIPHHGASRLVTSGPYRFTRNPMYTGLTAAYVGGAVLVNTIWPLLLLPIALLLLLRLVIRREEAYLTDAFGDAYVAYCRRVRRWL